VVLAFLGIFSAKYRRWAKEAFDCVARRVTLRPCKTGFNEKVRAIVTGAIMKRHAGIARFTHKHFESISWVFTISLFVSLAYTAYGMYNLATVGTCDPANPDQCIFNPGGDPNRVVCPYEDLQPDESVKIIGNFRDITSATVSGRPKAYFFGTTWCPHCGWERPIFSNVTARFSGYIDSKVVEIDLQHDASDTALFNHYSPSGKIPLIVLGGKYYRVGSGENLGVENETQVITAILCRITDSPIAECNEQAVKDLVQQL